MYFCSVTSHQNTYKNDWVNFGRRYLQKHASVVETLSHMNYACGSRFVVYCCGLVMVNFNHILQGCFTGTGAITWLPQCQWSNPEWYGQMRHMDPPRTDNITTTKQSTTKPRAYFMARCVPIPVLEWQLPIRITAIYDATLPTYSIPHPNISTRSRSKPI